MANSLHNSLMDMYFVLTYFDQPQRHTECYADNDDAKENDADGGKL